MARPKPALPDAAAILALADGEGRLAVRVSPSASADAILLPDGDGVLAVRITAPPVDGAANEAVLRLVATALDRPVSRLALIRGATGRNKMIQLID
ncbi:hypothetical protein GGQ80_003251 [Sphingomonas jinjuensis]|uniref:UPF0235 protein GGQ80_003251 n=1 Tax=Sphingomonas jinjuensis TaxID=535907 RepID=A0A840FEQ6_9SPHN|nr:DUF167 domain-containing protein [Sphingomonas jinjuensis]MBB4155331.1 hypothetical protein [Sphingomonas jinjuensis]